MSVYTRAGDKGKTHLYQGKVISKASLRIEAIGNIDELNSAIGLSMSELKGQSSTKIELVRIQNDLFEIGGALANPRSASSGQAGSKLEKLNNRVQNFEKIIDKLEDDLPPLANFILPGGGKSGSLLHLARTVSRRAERRIIELSEKEPMNSSIIVYMNRLSDLLFMFARFLNYKEKKKEIRWNPR